MQYLLEFCHVYVAWLDTVLDREGRCDTGRLAHELHGMPLANLRTALYCALPGGQQTVYALRQQHPVGQIAAAWIVLLVVVVDADNVVEAGAAGDIFVRHDIDALDALTAARAGQRRYHVELGTLEAGDILTEEGREFVDVGALVLGNPGHG